jgi:hypothetical protein
MSTLGETDRRIQERKMRERLVADQEVERAGAELSDSSGNVRELSAEEVEQFESSLEAEAELRAERIARALERAVAPPPKPPVPVQELDEDEI